MIKGIILLFVGILYSKVAFTQSKPNIQLDQGRKGFATFNIGIGAPTGNFSNNSFNNYSAGYAKTGAMIDLTFGYKIRPNLGITAMVRNQTNAIDIDQYAKDWEDFYESGSSSGNSSVFVEAQPYRLNSFMIGLYGTFKITNKLSLEPRILFGYAVAVLPEMTEDIYSSGRHLITYYRESANSLTITSIIGAGVNYQLAEEVNLMFNIDYHTAVAEWKDVKTSYYGHITGTYENRYYDYERIFSIINSNIGLGFRF